MDNYFARLNQINVSEHIERKGGFAYLSWPFAVAQLRLADPQACWEVRRFGGLPYLRQWLSVTSKHSAMFIGSGGRSRTAVL